MVKQIKKKKADKKKKPARIKSSTPADLGLIDQPTIITPAPTAGNKVLNFEKKLDAQIAAAPSQKKETRGRPRKDSLPPPAFGMDTGIIKQGVKLPFELWAMSQKLPELKLSDPESQAIAAPVKLLLDFYLPNVPEIGIAWISLAISCYSIMAQRLSIIAEIKKQKTNNRSPSAAEGSATAGHRRPKPPAGSDQGFKPVDFPTAYKPVKL